MCVYTYIYVHIYICICVHVYRYAYNYLCIYMHTYAYVYICACNYVAEQRVAVFYKEQRVAVLQSIAEQRVAVYRVAVFYTTVAVCISVQCSVHCSALQGVASVSQHSASHFIALHSSPVLHRSLTSSRCIL